MFKRVVFISGLFIFFIVAAHAQIAPPSSLGMRKNLPAVQDSVEEKIMALSQADAELMQKAQEYINQGKTSLAITELEKISNPWASHWLLSYLYESNVDYESALGEVSWLVSSCERHDLTIQLESRKDVLEKTIENMKQWEDKWDPEQDKKKLIFE
jgi:hypothetical protein